MANKIPVAKRQPGPHGRTEYPLYETFYALCPSARYVGGTSGYLCECARPKACLGARAAAVQAAAERDMRDVAQPLIIRNTLHIEERGGVLYLYGRCLRGDFLRLGEVKAGTQPRVQQDELAEVFDFKLIERPDFMDELIARMRARSPYDLKWEVTPVAPEPPEPPESLAQYELKDRREVYGNDHRSINRHSVRQYEYRGMTYYLDKTLDCDYYSLYIFTADRYPLATYIMVDGAEHWGSGLTWGQAEVKALAALKALTEQRDTPTPQQPYTGRFGSSYPVPHRGLPGRHGNPYGDSVARSLPRLTPRAPRALDYGEVLHSEDLVLGDTSRILDFGDAYRLCQDSQDVYDVLQGIGQPRLMAEYDGLFVRENEDEDMPPAEVWGFNGTPRREKQAELVYIARLDVRLPGNRLPVAEPVKMNPVTLESLPRVGPFMGVVANRVKTLADGRQFRCVAYNAYNAHGLINKQVGVAVLEDERQSVVCDDIQCGCGPREGVNMLLGMADADFKKFINEHPRHRYQI